MYEMQTIDSMQTIVTAVRGVCLSVYLCATNAPSDPGSASLHGNWRRRVQWTPCAEAAFAKCLWLLVHIFEMLVKTTNPVIGLALFEFRSRYNKSNYWVFCFNKHFKSIITLLLCVHYNYASMSNGNQKEDIEASLTKRPC